MTYENVTKISNIPKVNEKTLFSKKVFQKTYEKRTKKRTIVYQLT